MKSTHRIPKTFFFFLFLLLISRFTFAQTDTSKQVKSTYKSLLWEITGKGLSKPSYLYGTMHVSKKVAFHLADTFFIALNKSDAIALEEDPSTWMDAMSNLGDLSSSERGGIYGQSRDFYRNAFKIELPENKDLSQAFAFQPGLINSLLYRFNSREGNYEENTYLDLFIYQSARKIGKRVIGLETFEEGQEYSIKATLPDSASEENNNRRSGWSSMSDIYEKIEDAYRSADLDLLDSLSRLSNRSTNRQKYLIDERNRNFLAKMDSVLQTSTSLFTGVGAAHLPGENGLINLLRKKGYTVRPVTFLQSKQADKQKQKLEESSFDNQYTLQYLPDSSVSFMAPGKFFKLIGGALSFYIYPDMANGSYFTIHASNRFEPFTGNSLDYTMKGIDSLLYENVPGQILSKTYDKSRDGYPVINIMNRTRRGDVCRYKIVVAPEYVYVFSLCGTGEYARKKELDKFFNSIEIIGNPNDRTWKKVTVSSGGFTAEMPGVVHDDIKDGLSLFSKSDVFIHSFTEYDSSFYLMMRSNFPDVEYIEEDSFELSELAYRFATQFDWEISDKKFGYSDFGGNGAHPYLDATMGKDGKTYYVRVIINGPFYNLMACKPGANDFHERYFTSFRIQPLNYQKPFEEVKDTALHFSVQTFPEKSNLLSRVNEMFNYKSRSDKSESYFYNDVDVKSRTFVSPDTREEISLKAYHYGPFYSSKSSEKFWKARLKRINKDSTMIAHVIGPEERDSITTYSVLLTDTGSTRGIKCKMILKKDRLYVISTTIDTLTQPSKWVTTFFDSFTATDTAGESVFVPKAQKYMSYLLDKDSVKNKTARKYFTQSHLDSTCVPKLIQWYNDTLSFRARAEVREDVLEEIGSLNSDKSIPFLRDLYQKSSDSTDVQLAILKGLLRRQTTEGISVFSELLSKEAPLVNDEYMVRSMLHNAFDSLELAVKLFPGLLKLTGYQEYKQAIYNLLAELSLKEYYDKEIIRPSLSGIVRDANDELKRVLNDEKVGSDNEYDDDEDEETSMDEDEMARFKAMILGVLPSLKENEDANQNEVEHDNLIEDYALILAGFYDTDPSVKSFFTKLQKVKDENLAMKAHIIMLRNNIATPDSVWKNYSASRKFRSNLYVELLKCKQTKMFDKTYFNQDSMSVAIVYQDYKLEKDSLVFLEKRLLKSKSDSGYVYLYKFKEEDSDKWYFCYTYFQPKDTTIAFPVALSERKMLKENVAVEKQIDKVFHEVTIYDRKRARKETDYDYSGDYRY